MVDESRIGERLPTPVPVHAGVGLLMKTPRIIMMIALVATLSAGWGANRLWYDYNLLNMQPEGQQSVELEKRLLSECDQSVWYALSISDSREELLKRKANFLKLPVSNARKKSPPCSPPTTKSNNPSLPISPIASIRSPNVPPLIAVDPLDDLGVILAHIQDLIQHNPNAVNCARHLELLRDAMRRLPASECYAKLSQFQQQMRGDLLSRLHTLHSIAIRKPRNSRIYPPAWSAVSSGKTASSF